MINEWQPTTAININVLKSLVPVGQEVLQKPVQLSDWVSKEHQTEDERGVRPSENEWQNTLNDLSTERFFPLASVFTLAEMRFSGSQCGDSNAAIWIFRWLRSNKQQPEKEAIKKLKQLTDNRFIPYGSVL